LQRRHCYRGSRAQGQVSWAASCMRIVKRSFITSHPTSNGTKAQRHHNVLHPDSWTGLGLDPLACRLKKDSIKPPILHFPESNDSVSSLTGLSETWPPAWSCLLEESGEKYHSMIRSIVPALLPVHTYQMGIISLLTCVS
jgi:hypothetical protein